MYVNQNFVGNGLIPRPVEELDRLVRAGKAMAIARLTVVAFEGIGLSTDKAVQACGQFEGRPLEEAADFIWSVLKKAWRNGGEDTLLALFAAAEAAGE